MGAGVTSGALTLSQLRQLESEALRWEDTYASAEVIATSLGAVLRARQELQSKSSRSDRIIADLIKMMSNGAGAKGGPMGEAAPRRSRNFICVTHMMTAGPHALTRPERGWLH